MEDEERQINQRTIMRVDEYDESRRVMMARSDTGDLILTERCDGEVTMAAFGSFAHTRRVTIPARNIDRAMQAIGLDERHIEQELQKYFACTECFLSDLQDVFDIAEIDYAFSVWNGSEAAYRAAHW